MSTIDQITDRKPPYDLDAELCLLGSLVLAFSEIDEVATIIAPEDFYEKAHRLLYEHLRAMHEAGKKFDSTLLIDRLQAAGDYVAVGGGSFISKIINFVPNAAHARYYAEIVRDHSARRSMMTAALEILQDGYDTAQPALDYVSKSEACIFSAGNRMAVASGPTSFHDSVMAALDGIDRRANGKAIRGISTSFHGLDNLTGGFQSGEVTILAGRTSMGKTAMALNIAAAVSENHPVLFFSLEMDSISIAERMLAMEAKANLYQMRAGTLSNEKRGEVVEAASAIANRSLRVDDTSGRTISQIAAICRRSARREGLGLVVIDYLQMMYPDNPRDPRHEQVAKISRSVKTMARDLKVPVLCLAQVNRQTTATKDSKPALSHLRESGAIEQDADVVIFTHRPAYYTGAKPDGPQKSETAELIVAKNRQGPTGSVDVIWFGAWTSFANKADDRFAEENKAHRVTAFDEYNASAEAGLT